MSKERKFITIHNKIINLDKVIEFSLNNNLVHVHYVDEKSSTFEYADKTQAQHLFEKIAEVVCDKYVNDLY